MRRKIGCLLFCTALCVLLCATAYAEEVQWSWETGGILWVSCEGEMELSQGIPWEEMKQDVVTLKVAEGVTSIAEGAFADCWALKSLSLPGTLTTIERDAFRGCRELTWVTLPEKLVSIADGAFLECTNLQTVVVPFGVSSIDREAFEADIIIRGFSGTASHDYALERGATFDSCGSMLPEPAKGTWGEDGTWTLNQLGVMCISGTGEIPQGPIPWEASRAYIKELQISEGLEALPEDAFKNCRKLKTVTLPESLKAIGDRAFQYCTKLESLLVPDGVTEIGQDAFPADMLLRCTPSSMAAAYAAEHNQPLELLPQAAPAAETTGEAAPVEETGPAEETNPTEETGPAEETNPTEETGPAEETNPTEETEPAEETNPTEETGPAEETNPTGETEPAEETGPVEETEPVEETSLEKPLVLTVGDVQARAGETLEVTVGLESNPGICGLCFRLDYDDAIMTLKGYRAAQDLAQEDWSVGIGRGDRCLWVNAQPWSGSGDLLTLTFHVKSDAVGSDSRLSLADVIALDEHGTPLSVQARGGAVHVDGSLLGDVDRDGTVTEKDSLLLKQHVVGMIVLEDTGNADMNRDGQINVQDVLLLEKLLSETTS